VGWAFMVARGWGGSYVNAYGAAPLPSQTLFCQLLTGCRGAAPAGARGVLAYHFFYHVVPSVAAQHENKQSSIVLH
jgi:hypothetical protein